MAITKVSNSGFKSGMTKYDSFLAGNEAYDPAATWLISRTTLSTTATSITFSSIPSTYKHLQIKGNVLCNASLTFRIKFNSDTTAANYSRHQLAGSGTAASAGGAASSAAFITMLVSKGTVLTYPNVFITDVLDYASTSKNKTVRAISGADNNSTGGSIELNSGGWFSTSAVTSITIDIDGTNTFSSGSTFALYGFTG